MNLNAPIIRFSQAKPIYDYLKSQQENEKFIKTLEIAATFSLIVFFIYFAIRPTALTISTLLGDIESKKILKTQLNKKINDVIIAQDLFSQVEGKYSIINNALPDYPNYYDAVNQIKNSCQTNCELGALTFNFDTNNLKSKSKLNINSFSIQVSSSGSFLSTVDLVKKILENQRLITVGSISFGTSQATAKSSSPSAASNGPINTGFSSTFYYWPTE